MYISLYVDVNTFIGGRQPQNKLMRLRRFKNHSRYITLFFECTYSVIGFYELMEMFLVGLMHFLREFWEI